MVTAIEKLLRENASVVPFRDLPETYKLALVWYMAVDGEAWEVFYDESAVTEDELKASLVKSLPLYDDVYGNLSVGIAELSVEHVKDAIMQYEEFSGFEDWDAYHRWYLGGGDMPEHPSQARWPAIASDSVDEPLIDGWHRTHSYIAQGHATIPLVFFPTDDLAPRNQPHQGRRGPACM